MMTDDRPKKKWEFYVAGVQHHQLSSVIEMIAEGDDLTLQPEPENKYDPNAMKVLYNPGEVMLGYVPKRVSAEVTYAYRANNNELGCVAIRVSPESQPWTQLMVKVWIV